jgi:cytochrome c-type biogenesis protein CcmH
MMIWIVGGLILMAGLVILVWPLVKESQPVHSRFDGGIEVYRKQLEELERDIDRGALSATDGEALVLEVKRRMLKMARDEKTSDIGQSTLAKPVLVALIIIFPLVSLGIYADLGSPDQPSRPLASRDLEQERMALAGQRAGDLVTRLIEALQQQPDNLEGWILLARTLSKMERYKEAADTFMKATVLSPRDAGLYVGAGENYYFDAEGVIDDKSEKAFESALSLDPGNPGARYYLALRDAQEGNLDKALDSWIDLYNDSAEGAPFMTLLIARIEETAQKSGRDISDLGADKKAPAENAGPSREEVEAAADMSPQERQEMIAAMVERLTTRMTDEPTYDGLMRLGQVYGTQGEYRKSASAYGRALELKPDDRAAMAGEAFALVQASGEGQPIPQRAISLYKLLLKDSPDMPEALWYVGVAEAQDGNKEEALLLWRRLQKISPTDGPLYATVSKAIKNLSAPRKN